MDIASFIRVTVDGSVNYDNFVNEVLVFPEVQEVHSITGEGSHILKVRSRNTTALEQFLSKIRSLPGVYNTSTSIVLSTFKETRKIKPFTTELTEH